ncbi:MAG: hypothetical protein Q9227_007548 [Pyrenula ochraceoflavens]
MRSSDAIVDSFGPVIRDAELESEAIEDQVFIAREDDYGSLLKQIGESRKRVLNMMRLLGGKADVIKGFAKRCNEQYSVAPRGDIGLYLGDIQDHVVTMMSNLGHVEKMLSRSHGNYLAQLNVDGVMRGHEANRVLAKITLIGTILVPLNLITGLFGMNVNVPGKDAGGLAWFFGIIGVIALFVTASLALAKRMRTSSRLILLAMRKLPNIIVTGTPGVGKSVHCEQLVEDTGLRHLSINKVVKDKGCHEGIDEATGSWIVDEDKLLDEIEDDVKAGGWLIDWHACDLFPKSWIDLVVVLRCQATDVLFDRLKSRNYPEAKLQENLDAEIFGVLMDEARDAYDEEIVVELKSEGHEDLEANCERIAQWSETWKKGQEKDENDEEEE